jgi:hypothetical protein
MKPLSQLPHSGGRETPRADKGRLDKHPEYGQRIADVCPRRVVAAPVGPSAKRKKTPRARGLSGATGGEWLLLSQAKLAALGFHEPGFLTFGLHLSKHG